MILIKNRELLIPEYERYIGTNYDANVENRTFKLKRFTSGGTDLSNLTFKINLWFNGAPLDRAEMRKEISDDDIVLIWTVTESQVSVAGTIFAVVTGNDTNDTVKWSSFQGAFYTEKSIGDDIDTEYKKLIDRLDNEITARNAAVNQERAERTSWDNALSSRIDNIVSSAGDSNTEIVDARLGADGVTHATLKGRLDAEYNSLSPRVANNEQNVDIISSLLIEVDIGYLEDNGGNRLVNNAADYLVSQHYRAATDESGTKIGTPADAGLVGKTFLMGVSQMGLPAMYLTHPDIETLRSKADGTLSDVGIEFASRNINTKLKKFKVQGASSQLFPKKNYTITFRDNVVLNEEWGEHKKYVIKADWVDFSQMRNEICAKLWGKIRKSRINPSRSELVDINGDHLINSNGDMFVGESDPSMSIGLNYGAVDGYPICLYVNGMYWGIYSLMIPKDDWMAGMRGEFQHEAIVAAEQHSTATRFNGLVEPPNEDGEMYDVGQSVVAYGMEYVPDEDDMQWLSTSLNTMISAVMDTYSTPEECIETIDQYIDIDSAIDYMIFNCVVNNADGLDKNFVLDTWDGNRWYFAAYDMDGTFGNNYDGKLYISVNGGCTFAKYAEVSRLMNILYTYVPERIKARYKSLRAGVLSEWSFTDMVWNYAVNIPDAAFHYEALRWPERPGTHTNNHEQILRYYSLRCAALDAEIETL